MNPFKWLYKFLPAWLIRYFTAPQGVLGSVGGRGRTLIRTSPRPGHVRNQYVTTPKGTFKHKQVNPNYTPSYKLV